MVEESWEELARADLLAFADEEPEPLDIQEWIEYMEAVIEPHEVGDICVYLDGRVIPIDAKDIKYVGWYSQHDWDEVPQVKALKDVHILDDVLSNPTYWIERERPERNKN